LKEWRSAIDTSNLVVGQRVFMLSGPYCNKGTVIEVAPDGVTVQMDTPGSPYMGCVARFDMTGESLPDYGSEAGAWYVEHVFDSTGGMKDTSRRRRLSEDGQSILGPDGEFIRDLTSSEIQILVAHETFGGRDTAEATVEDWTFSDEEIEQGKVWQHNEEEKRKQFTAWWKNATYEERLALVNKFYDGVKGRWPNNPNMCPDKYPAEEIARNDNFKMFDRYFAAIVSTYFGS
jgi:hypothetical protein